MWYFFFLRLLIQEFWASEEYFFHDEAQIELVSKYCPKIRKMLFMFERGTCNLQILDSFSKLQDLELWGGAFYTDGLCELIQVIGSRLTHLTLIHVEELDLRALAIVTNCCCNLKLFGLQSCEFIESANIETAENQFRDVDRSARSAAELETRKLLVPMLELETIKIVSDCPDKFIEMLLGHCYNIKEIFIGMSTGISDEILFKVSNNMLKQMLWIPKGIILHLRNPEFTDPTVC